MSYSDLLKTFIYLYLVGWLDRASIAGFICTAWTFPMIKIHVTSMRVKSGVVTFWAFKVVISGIGYPAHYHVILRGEKLI